MSTVGSQQFDYYLSRLRVNIECAFGLLIRRWGILWRNLDVVWHLELAHVSSSDRRVFQMALSRSTNLILCLMKLHNFCIDEGTRLDELEHLRAGVDRFQLDPDSISSVTTVPKPVRFANHEDDAVHKVTHKPKSRYAEFVTTPELELCRVVDVSTTDPAPRDATSIFQKEGEAIIREIEQEIALRGLQRPDRRKGAVEGSAEDAEEAEATESHE
jgi:hypothetical protein